MTRLEHQWPIMMLAVVFGLAAPLAASATMYECAGAGGTRIYTDSPAQLKNCTSLGGGGASQGGPTGMPLPAPAMPSPALMPMPTDSQQGVDLNKAPSYFPGAMVPPPGTPPVADRDIGLPPIPPAPMAAAPGESAPARCSSSINPFNPLMAVPCAPSASHAQPATVEAQSLSPDLPPEPIPSVPSEAIPPQP